ncbi:hypothetical protein [Anaeromyxobacter oryzae]|uniref:Lipoprotein n=1 Tax=Anaeromyxobacter oryzae TaxID=2918170 RepID=A0ABN6MM66_9BACT|nr:hypothetical protein [Anaeromyxobacter oryzae]BDG02139.1 hypothetical protein AMOR_11350 [Anaeromyxobacter oryzae]
MKTLLAGLAAAALLSTGCMIHVPGVAHTSAPVSAQKCPPGHQWSDGTCHDKGKGHDPAKHDR